MLFSFNVREYQLIYVGKVDYVRQLVAWFKLIVGVGTWNGLVELSFSANIKLDV